MHSFSVFFLHFTGWVAKHFWLPATFLAKFTGIFPSRHTTSERRYNDVILTFLHHNNAPYNVVLMLCADWVKSRISANLVSYKFPKDLFVIKQARYSIKQ